MIWRCGRCRRLRWWFQRSCKRCQREIAPTHTVHLVVPRKYGGEYEPWNYWTDPISLDPPSDPW